MVRAANAEATSDTEQRENAEIAEELTNPIADLMIFPIQINYDQDIGPRDDGWRLQMNVQPVIPFHLTEHWNLISRIIVPVTYQEDIYPGEGSQFGLGDTSMSLYFSPKEPTSSGIIWGAGPQLLFPTASDKLLGREKWGAGPGVMPWCNPVHGLWALSGTMSGHMPATAIARMSTTHLYSHFWLIRGQARGPHLFFPKAITIGSPRIGPCRSTLLLPELSDGTSYLSGCRELSAIGWRPPMKVLKGLALDSR